MSPSKHLDSRHAEGLCAERRIDFRLSYPPVP